MGKTITISKDCGCGSIELANALAKDLGYEYLDKGIVAQLAKKMRTSKGEIRSFEDGTSISMFRFVSKYMTESLVRKILAGDKGYVDDTSYLAGLKGLMTDLADKGDVIIVGRGGQCVLKGRPDVVHVRLIAPMEYKKERLAKKKDCTLEEADNIIKRKEEESKRYIERLFGLYWNDPTLYHMTINLSLVREETAIDMIKGLL
ncbi:MAG: cytidylate kinase-like family protein [Thermodesulfobacteriota bacterium]|nr:cytidylate kinase-like family protein [Thermodesulfobacteriota bacterium]